MTFIQDNADNADKLIEPSLSGSGCRLNFQGNSMGGSA